MPNASCGALFISEKAHILDLIRKEKYLVTLLRSTLTVKHFEKSKSDFIKVGYKFL